MPKIKRKKYYAIHSKSDNFLHGVFPLTEDGLTSAKAHISKIAGKNKNLYYIKKK